MSWFVDKLGPLKGTHNGAAAVSNTAPQAPSAAPKAAAPQPAPQPAPAARAAAPPPPPPPEPEAPKKKKGWF